MRGAKLPALESGTILRERWTLDYSGATDVGRRRRHNEDSWHVGTISGCLVVADGMGGHEAGEIASRIASEECVRALSEVKNDPRRMTDEGLGRLVENSVNAAGQVIYNVNKDRGTEDGRGMGTTIVGLWDVGDGARAVAFNVGDSRLYMLRGGALTQVSTDHTKLQQWLDGGQVGPSPKRNVIYRALGPWPSCPVDTKVIRPSAGDTYLLCSDGLSEMVGDPDLREIMASAGNLPDMVNDLMATANARGGTDNITAVAARYTDGAARS